MRAARQFIAGNALNKGCVPRGRLRMICLSHGVGDEISENLRDFNHPPETGRFFFGSNLALKCRATISVSLRDRSSPFIMRRPMAIGYLLLAILLCGTASQLEELA
jgi:hypothetical protein